MFRKNKIQSGIDNNTIAYNSEDFDSLDIVKSKLKNKKLLNKLFVNPTKAMVQDVKDKYTRTTKYLINHWQFILKWSVYSLITATFILLNILLFMPFYGANVGENWTTINNTWMASLINNNIVYTMTPLGYVFVGISLAAIGISIFYFLYNQKQKKLNNAKLEQPLAKVDKPNKIMLYVLWALIGSSISLILITILIPPMASSLHSEQAITNAWTYIEKYQNNPIPTDLDKFVASVKTIYDHYGYTMPSDQSYASLINALNELYNKGLFATSSYYQNYWFFADVYRESISTISVGGIIVTVFYAVMIFVGSIVLPGAITYRNVRFYYLENKHFDKSWNIWKLFIYALVRIFSKNYIKAIKSTNVKFQKRRAIKKEERKNKETYSKFKKENRQEGMSSTAEEAFSSGQINNAAFTVITKEQIESHEANKAFLNVDGEWMYHDGEGNYFVAKNDDWIAYDINKAIHKVHTDANAKLNLDPSKKQYREGRFKRVKNKKSSTSIALPDEGLDDILKKLDI